MQMQEATATRTTQDILLTEYESVVTQLNHWDSLFWTKSQFFLVIESAFIAVILQGFKEQVTSASGKVPLELLFLFFGADLFNIYLCYVWFRTNRRNREYIRQRIARACEIESELGVLQTFTDAKQKVPNDHGSADWETHLPTVFIIVWVVLLVGAVVLPQ